MPDPIFTADVKLEPYWWEAAPRPPSTPPELPAHADVAIVGSGYTGLSAALTLARGGRDVVVLEAGELGQGASSRNAGFCGRTFNHGFSTLAGKTGLDNAVRVYRAGEAALDYLIQLIESEQIDCQFTRMGRFTGASFASHYELLARDTEGLRKHLGVEVEMVTKGDQHREVGLDIYHGGQVMLRDGGLHPALFHQGLLDRVVAAGATVAGNTPVTAIARETAGFTVTTPRGRIAARDVIVATNGYTGGLTPWQRRRVIPIGSYMIATEPLPEAQMDRLMPRDRVHSDTRKMVYYYRASPDRRRVLFGGRVSLSETDPRRATPRLHAELTRIFPELAETRVTHGWMGFVAYTFDKLPHLGRRDGIHYALGYCGSGISLASYFGARIGQQLLGRAEGRTGLDGLRFSGRPYYWGRPWFLAPAIRYYRWHDSLSVGG